MTELLGQGYLVNAKARFFLTVLGIIRKSAEYWRRSTLYTCIYLDKRHCLYEHQIHTECSILAKPPLTWVGQMKAERR